MTSFTRTITSILIIFGLWIGSKTLKKKTLYICITYLIIRIASFTGTITSALIILDLEIHSNTFFKPLFIDKTYFHSKQKTLNPMET